MYGTFAKPGTAQRTSLGGSGREEGTGGGALGRAEEETAAPFAAGSDRSARKRPRSTRAYLRATATTLSARAFPSRTIFAA